MSLIKCPKCGKQFSEHAEVCPHCGLKQSEWEQFLDEQKRIQEEKEIAIQAKARAIEEERRQRSEKAKKTINNICKKYIIPIFIIIILCLIIFLWIIPLVKTNKSKKTNQLLYSEYISLSEKCIEVRQFNEAIQHLEQASALQIDNNDLSIRISALHDSLSCNFEHVNLGLPSKTLWATKNVGAVNMVDCGGYYAWGEVATKTSYTWKNYKFSKGTYKAITGYTGKECTLSQTDDAAFVSYGEEWRMPLKEEMAELIELCTWEWTQIDGVKGYKVIGPNNNYIFLPAGGFSSNSKEEIGYKGCYWTATKDKTKDYNAYYLRFLPNETCLRCDSRCDGQNIRPVRIK